MQELKKYVASAHLAIQPFLDVRCFGAPELCSDRRQIRFSRYTAIKK
ncbi:MAG: hypothetical protein TU35_009165 [Thermoproteus sp. AZ2]|jgi:hypothetical protein|uniref:Uncharacterized protein n=1 Tax=Thermoproteus sp. AZ2 TaxID=1609232 RepID=A0ACC6V2U2_9CREN